MVNRMAEVRCHYNRSQLAQAIRHVGVKRGDVVFSHSNIGFFGFPEEGRTPEDMFCTVLGAFTDVLTDEGTLVVPTFTYSFCKGEPFDPDSTPSTCGIFSEMVRKHPEAHRSNDPIFSVAALGRLAEQLTSDVPAECFGSGSFWERFIENNGIVCNLNLDSGSTLVHYIEQCLSVPYRYKKLFTGEFVRDGVVEKGGAIHFCRDLSNPGTEACFEFFDAEARRLGLVRSADVGRGSVVSIRAADTRSLIEQELPTTPWFMTVSADSEDAPILVQPSPPFRVAMSDNASMREMVEAIWALPRDIVSDGYDVALDALSKQSPMTIHEYPTGTECWTWIVPEKWTCVEAYLETIDGKRILSYADDPLHVMSYSLPFEGIVSREELSSHLHVHPRLPDAVPFKFQYYERDWGLCCSSKVKASLKDDQYRVRINTRFSYSTLKVGETVVPGSTDQNIIFCAHLCHPAMVNDDLSGVVVGVDVMRKLRKKMGHRYTYRLLIVPETIGSIAFLSHNEELIPEMSGGLFLEMLGLPYAHALQRSFTGDTEMDRFFSTALMDLDPSGWTGDFRRVICNDDLQFNSPGVRVPMLSLSRVLPRENPDWPYPEYHSNRDVPKPGVFKNMEQSRDLVLALVDALEDNEVPVNTFKGDPFCSRYGLHPNFYADPKANADFFGIVNRIDGTRTIAQIAFECGTSFNTVRRIALAMQRRGLVEFIAPAPR